MRNRTKDEIDETQEKIVAQIPGKIIKVPVKKGEEVKANQTVIIVEAMKMQSEYKVKRDCIIKNILVNEGDTVESNQTLIELQ